MKYCPKCDTRYDEDILRFCMKDGTPLLDEEEPNFIAMPSEGLDPAEEDDPDDVTVIRRNPPQPQPLAIPQESVEQPLPVNPQRIVVSTDAVDQQQGVRHRPVQYQQPPQSNTFKTIVLTVLGTLFLIGTVAGVVWLFSNGDENNGGNAHNNNADQNLNINSANISLDDNTNVDFGLNSNTNANANVKSPTPTATPTSTPTSTPTATPTPRPTASPTRTPVDDDDDDNQQQTPPPPVTPPTPRNTPSASPSIQQGGVLNGRAINLARPGYPAAARAVRASGQVRVEVEVDEAGRVTSARATSGHPALRAAAEDAARNSRINPIRNGARTRGTLVYNFVTN